MNMPFRRQHEVPVAAVHSASSQAHTVTSDYNASICRFVLDCTCGHHFDTPYIDEALEHRELHERMAPLADQLAR